MVFLQEHMKLRLCFASPSCLGYSAASNMTKTHLYLDNQSEHYPSTSG